jgi:hypothetical protein
MNGYRTQGNGNVTRMEAINTRGNSIRGNGEEIGQLEEQEANILRRMEVGIPGPASCQMASWLRPRCLNVCGSTDVKLNICIAALSTSGSDSDLPVLGSKA